MRIPNSAIALMVCLSPLLAAGASASGTISGVVVNDKGAPITNAVVVYQAVPTVIRAANGQKITTLPGFSSSTKALADGSFVASGLPPGTYHLCAYGTQSNHLGSCEWGVGTTRVDLTAGQATQLRFVVAEGTLLTFQVEDPRHRCEIWRVSRRKMAECL